MVPDIFVSLQANKIILMINPAIFLKNGANTH